MICIYLVHLNHNTRISIAWTFGDVFLFGVRMRYTDAVKGYWNKARACALSACQPLTKHVHATIMAILLPGATGCLEVAWKACPAEKAISEVKLGASDI